MSTDDSRLPSPDTVKGTGGEVDADPMTVGEVASRDSTGEAPEITEAGAQALFKGVDPRSRELGLVLDRSGRFLHEGEQVTHARLAEALARWIDWDPEARRFRIRVTPELWAWVEVEDAPYQAHLEEVTADALVLRLSDGRAFQYGGARIAVGPDDAWYVPVGPPPLWARLDRAALAELADRLEQDPDDPEGFRLRLDAGRWVRFEPYRRDPE